MWENTLPQKGKRLRAELGCEAGSKGENPEEGAQRGGVSWQGMEGTLGKQE